jgi:hypothetical protein
MAPNVSVCLRRSVCRKSGGVAGGEGRWSFSPEARIRESRRFSLANSKRPREKAERKIKTTSRFLIEQRKLKFGKGKRLVVSKQTFAKSPCPL